MKKLFYIFVFLFIYGNIIAQNSGLNYPHSVVIPPPYNNPLSTNSSVVTINGFDNFYLGIDYGEPYIAVNPFDSKKQVCAYNTNNFYYTLNGFEWYRSYPTFGSFQQVLGDPVMDYDNLGNLFYVTLYSPNINTGPWGIAIARSTDNGVTWPNYYQAHNTTYGLADKEWITIDKTNGPYNGYLYIGWRQYGTSYMGFIKSSDHGVTWTPYTPLTGGQGAYLSVGPNGNIQGGYLYYACVNAYIGTSIYLHRSSNGGDSFDFLGSAVAGITVPGVQYGSQQRPTLKENHIRCDNMPRMAVDNGYTSTRGNVYIVYAANPIGPDLADIFFIKSTDNGVTFTSPIKLNDDATTTDQWMPTISLDNNTGRIYVSWYDSRNDPTNNIMTDIYGTTSMDGGVSFAPDSRISNSSFSPDIMATVNLSDASYIGDYFGTASTGAHTSITSWMDNRDNIQSNKQSFVGYNPDFAMLVNPGVKSLGNNDSTAFALSVPGIKGIFNDRVKFTAFMDTLPVSGNIQISFTNGRDSLTSFPDSVYMKVKTIGTVTPGLYHINILGSGSNGTPVHKRRIDLYINSSLVTIQTNRNGIVPFKVNGNPYNSKQDFVFTNGTVINVQAISPYEVTSTKYIFQNWSDAGDTSHNVTINNPMTLTAFYKINFKLIIYSTIPFTFGGNLYYDSAMSVQFGVTGRVVNYNGQQYVFRGWNGSGSGSYTSPDSSGTDTVVTISLSNAIVESPRWISQVGVQNISSELPSEYKLFQNFPNPFNPFTLIKFNLIKSGNVKITVYDVLGREIKILINEVLNPGKYSIDFNAGNLASGIYYYRITTNDFTDIKKMLLIK